MLKDQIDAALMQRATDLQIIPVATGVRIFHRINGVRRLVGERNSEFHKTVFAQAKNSALMDLAECRKEQFGEFEHVIGDVVIYVCAAIHLDEAGREVLTLSFLSRPFIAAVTSDRAHPMHAGSYQ